MKYKIGEILRDKRMLEYADLVVVAIENRNEYLILKSAYNRVEFIEGTELCQRDTTPGKLIDHWVYVRLIGKCLRPLILSSLYVDIDDPEFISQHLGRYVAEFKMNGRR